MVFFYAIPKPFILEFKILKYLIPYYALRTILLNRMTIFAIASTDTTK